MKVVLKNIALFVVLAFAFSALTGCTGAGNTPVANNSTTGSATPERVGNVNVSEKPKVNYPPAPSAIMQADIKLLDDSTFKLQDKKGKVVLVNLWATWCGPCIEEMPHLIEMHDKYKDKNFEVIGLNSDDETKEQIDGFAAKQKLNYPLGWAEGKLVNEFVKVSRLNGIPQTLLINREGQLTGVFTGGGRKTIDKMKETVEKVVGE
jgi:thiol-disulfide isomerase/thioredoxin